MNISIRHASLFSKPPGADYCGASRAFTLVEIAICLGIIGIALVAIIGILPIGMHTQRDSREETIVGQDASVLFEAVRSGSHGADDLTNHVYAVVNIWSNTTTHATGLYGYTNALAGQLGFNINNPSYNFPAGNWYYALTNGANIIGLISTAEFADLTTNAKAIPSLIFGGVSNHVVAYVSAISGLAGEQPPQDNAILRQDTFSYRVYCVNAPMPIDTNSFFQQPLWSGQTSGGVFYDWTYWQAAQGAAATDVPGVSSNWVNIPNYPMELLANQRELRMTFLWPLLPNGGTGKGRQTFRATVGGQLTSTNSNGWPLYFYQPQTFNAAH